MFNDNEKYQKLLTEIHELNRNIMLNENEKVNQISEKIGILEEKINNSLARKVNKSYEKFFVIILIILLINTFILILSLFIEKKSEVNLSNKKEVIKKATKTETEDILSLDKQDIVIIGEDEQFLNIKPIIRKGTQYTCKGNDTLYKMPYTVEIKGKLFSDRFRFILQENSTTKECTILKKYM